MIWTILYVICFVGALVIGAAATWIARAAGRRFGVLDHPAGRKAHAMAIPVTGGWGVFAGFIGIVALGALLAPALATRLPESLDPLPGYLTNLRGASGQILAILTGLAWIFAIGAVDDIRPLGPRFKLVAQVLAAAPLIIGGISIQGFMPWPPLGWLATIAWAVLLMNSFNFLDNMDGLCATIAAVIAAVLALAASQGGELWLPALFLVLSGLLAGFLLFNFHPASIFLGDSGSMTIGYLLAVFSIMTTFHTEGQPTRAAILIPVVVMGVPLFDTISVMLIRLSRGAPLMVGDHNHFSHRLAAMGFSVRQTAVIIGLMTGAIGLVALPLRSLDWAGAVLHLLAIVLLFCVVAALEFMGRRANGPND